MPIPESMEHKFIITGCVGLKDLKTEHDPDCPQCLNIAWAKWILANVDHRAHEVTDLLALKKLAEEK